MNTLPHLHSTLSEWQHPLHTISGGSAAGRGGDEDDEVPLVSREGQGETVEDDHVEDAKSKSTSFGVPFLPPRRFSPFPRPISSRSDRPPTTLSTSRLHRTTLFHLGVFIHTYPYVSQFTFHASATTNAQTLTPSLGLLAGRPFGDLGGGPPLPSPDSLGSGPLPDLFGSTLGSGLLFGPMFRPQNFPLRGTDYERQLGRLRHTAYQNQRLLSRLMSEMKPRKWHDSLTLFQLRAFSLVCLPDEWHISGAEEDIRAALAAVPLLALSLLYEGEVLQYVVVGAYDGRVVAFNIPSLLHGSSWFRKWEVLPPEVRAWLNDPDIFVVASSLPPSGAAQKDGVHASRVVETQHLFSIYQHTGIIRPHYKADVGDVTWQLTYAVGYHHRPENRDKFIQMVGEEHYHGPWPAWRRPGWTPSLASELSKQEEFFLYFEAAGLHLFVNRLLQHGLIYGGMSAVDPSLPLPKLFQVFLEGGEPDFEVGRRDPLGIRSDWPSPAQAANNPALRAYGGATPAVRSPKGREGKGAGDARRPSRSARAGGAAVRGRPLRRPGGAGRGAAPHRQPRRCHRRLPLGGDAPRR